MTNRAATPSVGRSTGISRRGFFGVVALLGLVWVKVARAMGQSGAFSARRLTTAQSPSDPQRDTALARWGWEVVRRTSAPAKLSAVAVRADAPELLLEPFVIWGGATDVGTLLPAERRGLEAFLRLGGVLVVDDTRPTVGEFTRSVKRELLRVLPDASSSTIDASHVIFKTFYLLTRVQGRVTGPERIEVMSRGAQAQVIFLSCDLLGAMASKPDGQPIWPTEPAGSRYREMAIRLAVNLSMYALCSDYKNDQVHASWLMRRRGKVVP